MTAKPEDDSTASAATPTATSSSAPGAPKRVTDEQRVAAAEAAQRAREAHRASITPVEFGRAERDAAPDTALWKDVRDASETAVVWFPPNMQVLTLEDLQYARQHGHGREPFGSRPIVSDGMQFEELIAKQHYAFRERAEAAEQHQAAEQLNALQRRVQELLAENTELTGELGDVREALSNTPNSKHRGPELKRRRSRRLIYALREEQVPEDTINRAMHSALFDDQPNLTEAETEARREATRKTIERAAADLERSRKKPDR